MKPGPASSLNSLMPALLQCAIVLGGLLALVLMPPRQGDMLLLPLHPGVSTQRAAVDSGAVVLGVGRFGGVVVRGDRARLMPSMLRSGVAVVAAAPILCGEGTA